jgi:hypothetical protein
MSETLVYSDEDPCALARYLLQKYGGSREEALRRLLGPPCTRQTAEQVAIATAHCFGLATEEFMRVYSRIKRGEPFTLPEPAGKPQLQKP